MSSISGYRQFGGTHPETAALRNMLAFYDVRAPHTDEPFSEALLLGIGGGTRGGYWVFEFGGIPPVVALGARNDWQLGPGLFIARIAERLGVPANVHETTSANAAGKHLSAALDAGQPAAVAVDMASVPHMAMPPEAIKYYYHLLVAVDADREAGIVTVDDRSAFPLTMTWDELANARKQIGTMKHRMVTIAPSIEHIDIVAAIRAGIRDCAAGLLEPPIRNFGLSAWEKWSGLVANHKDKKGWPTVFLPGPRLYNGLLSAVQWIETAGNGPGMLRAMFADFLDEAATITGNDKYSDLAARYRDIAALWSELAAAALHDEIAPLRETRELILRRDASFLARGPAAFDEMQTIDTRLTALKSAIETDFPLNLDQSRELLEGLRYRLITIHVAEVESARALT